MPYFIELMSWLAERGIPSARPIPDRHGRILHNLLGRPAALVRASRRREHRGTDPRGLRAGGPGAGPAAPGGDGFPMHRDDRRGMAWRHETAAHALPEARRDRRQHAARRTRPSRGPGLARAACAAWCTPTCFRTTCCSAAARSPGSSTSTTPATTCASTTWPSP